MEGAKKIVVKDRRLAIAELLTAANNQYRVTWDALALELAVNALQDLYFEDLKRAVTLWLIESHWPPTIADLRGNYTRVQQERVRETVRQHEVEQAREWEKIRQEQERAGFLWMHLEEEKKQELLAEADRHPLREYMSRETIAKNILLFGDGRRVIGEGKKIGVGEQEKGA